MAEVFSEVQVDGLARLLKLLGDANRLRILFTIGVEERSVSQIIEATALPQTLVSFHLRVLRDAGMVGAERRGPFIYYRVNYPDLLERVRGFEPYVTGAASLPERSGEPPFACPPWRRRRC